MADSKNSTVEIDDDIIEMESCVKMSLWKFNQLCKERYQESNTSKGCIKFFGETGKHYMSTIDNNNFNYSVPGKWKEVIVIDDLEHKPEE